MTGTAATLDTTPDATLQAQWQDTVRRIVELSVFVCDDTATPAELAAAEQRLHEARTDLARLDAALLRRRPRPAAYPQGPLAGPFGGYPAG